MGGTDKDTSDIALCLCPGAIRSNAAHAYNGELVALEMLQRLPSDKVSEQSLSL